MPNEKITQLNPQAAPAYGSLIEVVTDPLGTPVNEKVTRKAMLTLSLVIKTATYTLTDDDDIVIGNSAAAMTLNLPPGATRTKGRPYWIKSINDGIVTIDPDSAETINANPTLDLANRDSYMLVWTGSAWETF